MRITLTEWKQLEQIIGSVRSVIEKANGDTFALLMKYHSGRQPETPESELLWRINQALHELRASVYVLPDVHPQSEWLGGDSEDPNNHTLREPNCCPMPRRRFTKEEIAEAKLECLGPCQWRPLS